MDSKRAWFIIINFLVFAFTPISFALGKDYPTLPVQCIIGFAPGGPTDTATRIIQPPLQDALGVPVVLTNKDGAGGALAADFVLKAKPDGYTILSTTNATMTIAPNINPSITFKYTDFIPICTYAADLSLISSKTGVPWNTLEGLVDYAKKNPGKLSYGTPGVGSVQHLVMEAFKLSYGLDIVPVHFKGSGPVKNAILGGHVDLACSAMGGLIPLIRAGSIIPLVTSSDKRLTAFPNIPTLAEKGLSEASINSLPQLFLPRKCPRDVLERLAREMHNVMKDPAVESRIEKAGLSFYYKDSAETLKLLEKESNHVANLVKKLGIVK